MPASWGELEDDLQSMRPQLKCDERTREVTRLLFSASLPGTLAVPVGKLLMRAGIDLLPGWAIAQLELIGPAPRPALVNAKRRLAPFHAPHGVPRLIYPSADMFYCKNRSFLA